MSTIFTASNASKSRGPLTTFSVKPQDFHFETQEEGEEVILYMRQHLIVLFFPGLLGLLLILAPLFLTPIFVRVIQTLGLPFGYAIVAPIAWYVATFGYLLGVFLHWFFNIYIVTSQRVIDIDFVNLLYKEFSEAHLSKIQDVSYTSGGIMAAFFNYGTVRIETAGEYPNLEYTSVPHPDQVISIISQLTKKGKQSGV